jgi:hypothetical protein
VGRGHDHPGSLACFRLDEQVTPEMPDPFADAEEAKAPAAHICPERLTLIEPFAVVYDFYPHFLFFCRHFYESLIGVGVFHNIHQKLPGGLKKEDLDFVL